MTQAVEVRSYGPAGTGAYLVPTRRRGVAWLDELNAWGSGQVQVHASDTVLVANPGMLAHGRIIKFHFSGAERFAFRIERRETQVVSRDEQAGKWITASGRGLGCLLADAVIYPEYGLTRKSGEERRFTFASAVGDWYVSAEWVAPLGIRQDSDTTARAKNPAGWPDPAAQWIWPTDPTAAVAGGLVSYFRGSFTLATATQVVIYATADDAYNLFLNGEEILTSDIAQVFAWRNIGTITVDLAAGTHLLAAKVTNTTLADAALNPAGFLCTVATLTATGAPSSFILRTDTTNWLCHSGSPGWRANHILSKCLSEAQARSVPAATYLTASYTPTADTTGVAWTDRQDTAVRVGVDTALDVATKLAESAIDIAVRPTMQLDAWKRRGTDRTTTLVGPPAITAVTLAAGVSLVEHKIISTAATATRLLVRADDGWTEVVDTAGETASGRKEAGLQLGLAKSSGTATTVAQAVFVETATAQTVIESGQMPARTGATPYVDFGVGDDINTIGETGAALVVRVSALACVEDENGSLLFTPELYA